MFESENKKAKVLSYNVDLLTKKEALEFVVSSIETQKNVHVLTINPEIIQNAICDKELDTLIRNADLTIADGIGIEIALKLQGKKAKRIPGIEFADNLLEIASKNGLSVALIGAKSFIVEKAIDNLKKKFASLNIAYYHDGYFKNEEEDAIIDNLSKTDPKIVLVAMGGKKQEMFISKLKNKLKGCVFVGVGGSFDVWSGYVKRAPIFFQKVGLEWLYRVLSEPSRFKRIFPALPIFLFKVIIYSIKNEKSEKHD